ncbi:MAG: aldo/keto reductase [Chitinophagales bacterium]|nr:aldo/keto reductase [Chitinophagales bacterium]
MEYRRLGNTGLQISALSLGSWLTFGLQISDEVAEQLMRYAYEQGVNFFDNAEVYAAGKSEVVMGNILKKMGWDRSTYLVSSKVFWGGDKPNQKGLSRKHIMEACDAALKRLQLDYLDLFYCHRPDINTPMEETVWAMHHLVQQGKILYWGTSEWSAQEITHAHMIAAKHHLIPPVVEQPQYNMLQRQKMEADYHRIFKEIGMGTTIWSPLASGILTGKYNDGLPSEETRATRPGMDWLKDRIMNEAKLEKARQLDALAKEIGTSLTRLSIAWCLKNPNVSSVIMGASKMAHLEDNIQALSAVPLLTHEVTERIEAILQNQPKFEVY